MKMMIFVFRKRVQVWGINALVPRVFSSKKRRGHKKNFYSPRAGLHRKGERGERKMSN